MNEDIKWANAAELGHMTQQVKLLKSDQMRISEFLVIANETRYNDNLENQGKDINYYSYIKGLRIKDIKNAK